MEHYPENIKNLRKQIGKTQEEFGELVGASRGAIAQWELGKNQPGVIPCNRMCYLLRTDAETFLFTSLDFSQIVIDLTGIRTAADIDKKMKMPQQPRDDRGLRELYERIISEKDQRIKLLEEMLKK